MQFLDIPTDKPVELAQQGGIKDQVHVFEDDTIMAINAALAASRPLLVRGEPGIGKSQLARAAAKSLGRVFLQHVVDSRTEAQDLLWHFDAVERLAEAQLSGALASQNTEAVRKRLAVGNFLRPGVLWWAFSWTSAAEQAEIANASLPPQPDGGKAENGAVVLVDEIDKAETDVPNGLLEAMGSGQFTPFGYAEAVKSSDPQPLVVITTNEERALPDAFVRRCLVLHLALPEGKQLETRLIQRGKAHFPEIAESILEQAAEQLAKDRRDAVEARWRPLPGQAEYLDLLRALHNLAPGKALEQEGLLEELARFTLKKRAGAA